MAVFLLVIGAHSSIYRGEIGVTTDLKTGKGQPCTVHVATPREQHSYTVGMDG